MESHTSSTTEIHTTIEPNELPPRKSWRESEAWQSFTAIRPVVSWIMIGVMTAATIYISSHDAKAEQDEAIRQLQTKTDQINQKLSDRTATVDQRLDKMVDKELFNERTNNLDKKIDGVSSDVKEVLNLTRLNSRAPIVP